ncbi:MAG: hypothetical protein ABSF63_00255 [Candidatus Bathyarchaeia archaeon]|jgi:hypothetical protein
MTVDLEHVSLRQKHWVNELQAVFGDSFDQYKERVNWFAYGMAFMEEVIFGIFPEAKPH